MRNNIIALKGIFVGIFIFLGIQVYSQKLECKVLIPEISGSYSGDCKNGLAHGKGTAQGTDRYEGQFSRGIPQGKGIYTWANGTVYKGQWVKGLKDGEGVMTYHLPGRDSVITGYWKNDNYAGKEFIQPYIITRTVGVLNSNFRKISEDGNDVIVRFLIGGQINTRISGFGMAFNNGSQYKSGPKIGVQNIYFPFDLKINYVTSNPISRSSFEVIFECIINDPGRWEITINN